MQYFINHAFSRIFCMNTLLQYSSTNKTYRNSTYYRTIYSLCAVWAVSYANSSNSPRWSFILAVTISSAPFFYRAVNHRLLNLYFIYEYEWLTLDFLELKLNISHFVSRVESLWQNDKLKIISFYVCVKTDYTSVIPDERACMPALLDEHLRQTGYWLNKEGEQDWLVALSRHGRKVRVFCLLFTVQRMWYRTLINHEYNLITCIVI